MSLTPDVPADEPPPPLRPYRSVRSPSAPPTPRPAVEGSGGRAAGGESTLLSGLTPSQQAAVLATEGPVLVLAGPGSGKTRVVTRRIAHLLHLGVRPWEILAVTFTNKAALEMRHRVEQLLGDGDALAQRGLTVTTFHSFCVRLLRRYGDLAAQAGCPVVGAGFGIYDGDEQQALIKKVLADLMLSSANWPPRTVLAAISNAKNDLLDAKGFAALAGDFYNRQIAKVYEKYEQALMAASAVDFDDLLLLAARMLRECGPVRAEVQRRYRYLMVDEYQDTNKAQLAIVSTIAGPDPGRAAGPEARRPNIFVVGDPDQSIYGWRGADIANILEFEEQFPSARTIPLGENFRSIPAVLMAADRLIRHNRRRKHKPLIAVRKSPPGGGAIDVVITRDEHHEAHMVLDMLKRRREDGLAWKDMAVFYRNNALSRVLEDTLRGAGVPYVLVRGTAFFQREEVRHLLAYLKLAANPADGIALERIVNTPARGISDPTLDRLEAAARERRMGVYDAMRTPAVLDGLAPRAAASVQKFTAMVDGWAGLAGPGASFMGVAEETREEVAPIGALAALVERVVRESGLEQMYEKEDERKENLAELVSSAREFEETFRAGLLAGGGDDEQAADTADPFHPSDTGDGPTPEPAEGDVSQLDLLRAYLERVALVADSDAIDPEAGAVTLMTLHAAKGLEYKAVALIGLEEGLLPHSRSQENEAALEEERRLCFVGITRAMDSLLMTAANYRTIRGLAERQIPSRFVDELRGEGVRVSDQADPLGFDDEGERDQGMREYLRGGAAALGGGASSGASARGGEDDEWRDFVKGAKVRHPQFGLGVIESVTRGAEARVGVKFAMGTKTLVLRYARLVRV
ncbi:MAG: ATP-dependent helicase [Phycisphaerales bacterium]